MTDRSDFIRDGVVLFGLKIGLTVWILTFIVMPVMVAGEPPNWDYLASREFFIGTLASLVLWPMTGVAWGWYRWKRSAGG